MLYPASAAAPQVDVRKLVCTVEDVWHDNGPRLAQPLRRGSLAAVLRNPYAVRYVENIQPMMEALKPLGREMAARLVEALGGADRIEAYGKGALIGLAGELEHGALWHVPGGYGMRDLLEGSHAIVPSTTKIGAAGASLDVPIHHRAAARRDAARDRHDDGAAPARTRRRTAGERDCEVRWAALGSAGQAPTCSARSMHEQRPGIQPNRRFAMSNMQ